MTRMTARGCRGAGGGGNTAGPVAGGNAIVLLPSQEPCVLLFIVTLPPLSPAQVASAWQASSEPSSDASCIQPISISSDLEWCMQCQNLHSVSITSSRLHEMRTGPAAC